MSLKILVVTHKPYQMPEDPVYIPIQVGNVKLDYDRCLRDNSGDNIAESNARFCELTAIYWAWKNLEADYIGFTHYRRHFTTLNLLQRFGREKFECIATAEDIERCLEDAGVIVPNKRKYYIETIESHYLHLPYTFEKDYRLLRNTIASHTPEYVDAYDLVMNRTWAHMFNMFIMKRELFDAYCKWMFPILFDCDRQINTDGYTTAEARTIAYFGEFMLDIWIEFNRIPYVEMDVMFMERQNWIRKGGTFLVRRIGLRDAT